MATLYKLEKDGAKAQRWEINCTPVVIGRSTGANIRIEDDSMSRRHLMILLEEDGYVVRDLNSRNGTWVGGERVAIVPLRDHDSIRAGSTDFVFEEAARNNAGVGPHGTVVVQAA